MAWFSKRSSSVPPVGLSALKVQHPWPDISSLDGEPSYVWSLDGGGRHLIVELIRDLRPSIFLELGTFLGGSALQWLENSPPSMTLIVGDVWGESAQNWIFEQMENPAPWIADVDKVRALAAPLQAHGIFKVAMHNLREFRDRVVPMRMSRAELYSEIKTFLEPDIIYIDAGKERPDYIDAEKMFPKAVLCGDDWEWQNERGDFPVRAFVHELAERRNCDVVVDRATWVLRKS